MKAVLLGLVVSLIAPSTASAWSWGKSSKQWRNSAKKPKPNDYRNRSLDYRKDTPRWKQRFDGRKRRQWRKPGGVNFPTPRKRPRYIVLKRRRFRVKMYVRRKHEQRKEQLKKQQETQKKNEEMRERQLKQNRSLFQRFRIAWKLMWKNRHINAEDQQPFATTGGFGSTVNRSMLPVTLSWRRKRELRRRIQQPSAEELQRRRLEDLRRARQEELKLRRLKELQRRRLQPVQPPPVPTF